MLFKRRLFKYFHIETELVTDLRVHCFYNQLGSALRPQSCLYFEGCFGLKVTGRFLSSLTK